MVYEHDISACLTDSIGAAGLSPAQLADLLHRTAPALDRLRAGDLPFFEVTFNGVACTTNPLGVKGCGEVGAIAGFPAIANAIGDALVPLDTNGFDGPATAERVWRLIQDARH